MGRPVVSTAAGNLAQVLRPPRGRAVASRDPQELATAVAAELKTSRDPQRRAAIRKEIVATYGLATMADAYAALFAGNDPIPQTEDAAQAPSSSATTSSTITPSGATSR